MTDRIINTVCAIMTALILWLGVSWVDVVSDNTRQDPQHSNMNFFVVMTELWSDSE